MENGSSANLMSTPAAAGGSELMVGGTTARSAHPATGTHARRAGRWARLRLTEHRAVLALVDLTLLNAVLMLALELQPSIPQIVAIEGAHMPFVWHISASIIWLTCAVIAGGYELRSLTSIRTALITAAAAGIAGGIYILLPFIAPRPERRVFIYLYPALAAFSVGIWRLMYARFFAKPLRRTALVVGAGSSGHALMRLLDQLQQEGALRGGLYAIAGFIDDDPQKQGMRLGSTSVLGTHDDLMRVVTETRADEVVIAVSAKQNVKADLLEKILTLRERGLTVTKMSTVYQECSGRVPVSHVGNDFEAVMPSPEDIGRRVFALIKRTLDVLGALVGCVILLLVIPLVWTMNLFGNRGPLFFRQERVGQGSRVFNVLKFRSMVTDAERETGPVWATEDDPRITKVGRFLRRSRLDEIPQFWNILRGEMSLIGPRPERPEIIDAVAIKIPYYRARHAVRPGLTGWAQVMFRYAASVEDVETKLEYDLYYIKRQGILLDVIILLRTVQVVLGLKGR